MRLREDHTASAHADRIPDLPPLNAQLEQNGAAAACGVLSPGDAIVSVNGVSVGGLEHVRVPKRCDMRDQSAY
eukprot:2171730-Pleurochrysis_carterae.AAC.1